jgi:hypothetical protein
VPAGGAAGQALVKASGIDRDTQWSGIIDRALTAGNAEKLGGQEAAQYVKRSELAPILITDKFSFASYVVGANRMAIYFPATHEVRLRCTVETAVPSGSVVATINDNSYAWNLTGARQNLGGYYVVGSERMPLAYLLNTDGTIKAMYATAVSATARVDIRYFVGYW